MKSIKQKVRFYIIFIIKIFLYSIPIKYKIRKHFFGKHRAMDKVEYSREVFDKHVSSHIDFKERKRPKRILEIGPGDSCFTAIMAMEIGVEEIVLIDKDLSSINISLNKLINKGIIVERYHDLDQNNYKAEDYILESKHQKNKSIKLKIIESDFKKNNINIGKSFNVIFSNAVLQHLNCQQLENLIKLSIKSAKKETIHSHQVRFTDHISGKDQKFDHHSVPKAIWNNYFIQRLPFWTNRLEKDDYLNLFYKYGMRVNVRQKESIEFRPVNQHFILNL